MCRANSGPGSPSATTSEPLANAACMSFDKPRIVERRLGFLELNHQPGTVAVRERDGMHCAPFANLSEQRKGIVDVKRSPGLKRLLDRHPSPLVGELRLVSLARRRSSGCLGVRAARAVSAQRNLSKRTWIIS